MNTQEQDELWKQYRDGDRSVYDALVESYLPMVKVTVGRMAITIPSFVDREELYSAGCMGLISAIDRYDPSREAKFTTYAITRIRGAILDELRSHDALGRVTRDRVTRIHHAETELKNRGSTVSPESVAEEAGLSMDEYWDAEMGEQAARLVSLSEPADDEAHSLGDLLARRGKDESPGQEMELAEVIELIYELLDDKEQLLVVLYYQEELTLREIGEILQVSESRVCQLHTAMAQKIRKKLESKGIFF